LFILPVPIDSGPIWSWDALEARYVVFDQGDTATVTDGKWRWNGIEGINFFID